MHTSPHKSRSGLARLMPAAFNSWRGLGAALRHEAAFRQELGLAVVAIPLAWWLAPGRLEALALTASVLLVLIVELLNSAVEAVADAVTLENHPLIGRAKDIGSAAVSITLALAGLTWLVVLWPR